MADPIFDFYEEVRIKSLDQAKSHLNGQIGVILGRTPRNDASSHSYGVALNNGKEAWCFFEDELESTGRIFRREDFYDGTVVKVHVDEHGRATLARPEGDVE